MGTSSAVLTPIERDGAIALGSLLLLAVLALAIQRFAFVFFARIARKHENSVFAAMVHRMSGPSRLIFPLVAILAGVPIVPLPAGSKDPIERLLGLAIVGAVAWLVVALVGFGADLAKRRYRLDEEDNLHARQVDTRLDILTRTLITLIILVAVSAGLMTFPAIRAIGATLLASAGLAGIAAGLAARPILENLVAGVQIALTQPIRIDDVVIVETEYGRIEKITATYVVVRLWDWRRMVLPLTYFIEHPFQNWTYSKAELIGSVFLYLDYTIPVDAVREEVPRILAATPLWDKNVVNVALTDAKESTVELRILVSARNSSELFDLRCLVREKLIAFVRERYPASLPGTKVQLVPAAPASGAPPPETQRARQMPREVAGVR
jgi:small-conductance mechanosensitive channel